MSSSAEKPNHSIGNFEQILFLPLYLPFPSSEAADGKSPEGEARALAGLLDSSASKWTEIVDLLAHLGPVDSKAYEEFVYFHGHLQAFLFPRNADSLERGPWGLRLFERQDLRQLELILESDKDQAGTEKVRWCTRFDVRRLQLYLSAAGVAVLVVELGLDPKRAIERLSEAGAATSSHDLDLRHVLALQNAVRRLYPPFFEEGDGKPELYVKYYPRRWAWRNANGDEIGESAGTPEAHVQSFRAGGKEDRPPAIPLANVWRYALLPLIAEGDGESRSEDLRWALLGDDRMPSMLYLGAPGAPHFTDGEWARICFMDDPDHLVGADTMEHAYADRFMRCFTRTNAYDRFWNGKVGDTRYLIASSSITIVAALQANPEVEGDDYFARAIIPHHLRRHYFRMGLMLHFQHAALLAMSAWAGTIVRRYGGTERYGRTGHRRQLRKHLAELHQKFLVFATQIWAPNLSNQLQGRELHEQWRREIGSEKQFDALAKHLGGMSEHLETIEQGANTEASTQLAGAATLAAVVALPIAFLSIMDEGLFGKFGGKSGLRWETDVLTFLTLLAAAALSMLLASWMILLRHNYGWFGFKQWWRSDEPVARIMKCIAVLPLLAVLGWVARWRGWW